MKVVALISGGKDSCYSMLCCEQHGHEVVALANLLPSDDSVHELDSYMYQTVGHTLVEAYAACTGLPLYRRRIAGGPKAQGLTYSATRGDEVEDLYALLAFIKARHPEVAGIASGAIASDYQRLRVEDVAARLGLTSLAYLWHRPQEELLRSMIESGIEAVLVKVAALGLDPHRHLGRTLAAMEPALHSLRDRFGCNVCGEGGEYETLTLDCPAFRRGRIVLEGWDVAMHSPDAVAPVGVLQPAAFRVERKGGDGSGGGASDGDGTVPEAAVVEVPLDWQPPPLAAAPASAAPPADTDAAPPPVAVRAGARHAHVLCAPVAAGDEPPGADGTAAAVHAALSAIGAALPGLGLTWDDSLFVHLYLSDMAQFAAANAAYCQHLPRLSPPSRACVQLPLPGCAPLAVDVLFARRCPEESSTGRRRSARRARRKGGEAAQLPRRVLHVQSVSDWAPSCIGPYSQATSCGGLIHMAGQIPLDPGSMAIAPGGFVAQARLALANTQAAAVAAGGCLAAAALGLAVYVSEAAAGRAARREVQALLAQLRADAVDFVARAERERLRQLPPAGGATSGGGGGGVERGAAVGEEEEAAGGHIDEYLRPPRTALRLRPPVVYLEVPALPRGALLEVQPLLLDVARGAADQPESSSSSSSSSDGGDSDGGSSSCSADGASSEGGVVVPPAAAAREECARHLYVQRTASPSGALARVLLQVEASATADGLAVPDLAASAAAALVRAAPRGGFESVRCWCVRGAVDAAEWGEALAGALLEAGSRAAAGAAAVQSVPVCGVWVCQGDGGGGDGAEERECCVAVEALACAK